MVINMKISLDEINENNGIEFNYDVIKDEDLDKRILDLTNSKAIGSVYLDSNSSIVLECTFKGTMLIEDSISLDPIPYDFNIEINENLEEMLENYDGCFDNVKNTLDLKQILWQNIVLEVPISYTKVSDASLKGDGWELLNGEKKTEEIDPRLKKLEELLERRD